MSRIVRIIAILVLIFAAYWGNKWLHRFPGEFFITRSNCDYCKVTTWRNTCLTWYNSSDRGYPNEESCPGFTISPDGQSTAYIRLSGASTTALAVSRLDGTANAGQTAAEVKNDLSAGRKPLKVISLPGGSSFNRRGNLAWSPDCKYIAWASINTLYIANVATGKVETAALPLEDPIGKLYKAWPAYKRTVHLPAPGKTPELRSPKEQTEDERMQVMIDLGNLRLRRWLGIDPAQHFVREDLCKLESLPYSEVEKWSLELTCNGRSLTWVTAGTIYCDNWKLKIDRKAPGGPEVAATMTPLPSEVSACPYWSPRGDRAAYRFQTYSGMGENRRVVTHFVVVDSSGKILWRHQLKDWASVPHWSRDGKYFAVLNIEHYTDWNFRILEPGTAHSWRASVPRDVADYPLCQWSTWDWKL